jgi:N-methylhydantoinase B
VSVRTITIKRIVDVLLGALAQIIPDRVHAASCGQAAVFHVGGVDPETRRPYVTMIGVPIAGGMGARPTKDGIDVIDTDMTNLMSQPVEATESEYPVRIHYCRLWSDSGGAGRMRGGLGYEALCELERGNATMTHRRDRHNFQPWGLLGGEAAPVSKTVIIRSDGTELSLPSKTVVRLAQGDQVRIFTAGGGGYGDPLERPAGAILDDVVNGRVSPEAAFERYGVVLRPEGAAVDEPATQARRETLNAQRGPMAWTFDRGETFPSRVGRPRWE